MISIKRAVKPGVFRAFAARTSANTDVATFMRGQGATGKSVAEVEASWLAVKGGSGKGLNELWGTYLSSKGVTTGSLKERMKNFMNTGSQA